MFSALWWYGENTHEALLGDSVRKKSWKGTPFSFSVSLFHPFKHIEEKNETEKAIMGQWLARDEWKQMSFLLWFFFFIISWILDIENMFFVKSE